MKSKKTIVLLATIIGVSLLVSGCGKSADLKNGKEKAVSFKGGSITADSFYKSIKTSQISKLVDDIDHKLFDEKYKSDSEEDQAVKQQITQMKSSYADNEDGFISAIQQYFGVQDENELEDMLRLEYKRNEAVKDYISDNLTDDEIKGYYDENIIGDINAMHILISPDTDTDATDDEKKKAEDKALKKAQDIIKKINNKKDFEKMAKKYSDDKATASDGGNLGYINNDDMDENFMEALKKLEDGKYTTEPIKTQYGYHIIYRINQKSKAKLKKVKDDIKETLTEDKLNNEAGLHYQTLIDIRESKKIKWNDSELKKAYDDLMKKLINNANSNSTVS